MTLSDLKTFLTPRYVLHLEQEVEYLRGQVSRLTIVAEMNSKPAPHIMRTPPVPPKPARTSWEVYRDEQIALQEKEDLVDGTHSSGR